MAVTHLMYLHGFRSSPRSFKAQRMRGWLATRRPDVEWWCPQLPPSPAAAMVEIEHGIAGWPADRMAVVGSSLGGFYATCVAQRRGCFAVVMNPAVHPARDLSAHIGVQTAYHDPGQRFVFEPAHLAELRSMTPPSISHPERILAIIAKGDELLDWREMSERYAGARLRLIEGSDHALSDFDDHLPTILDFLGLTQ